MPALVPRSIDWIDVAPVKIVAQGRSIASPDAVFAVLADHERWPEWFPGVRKVQVLGAATGVGARRRVTIPGATVEEEFIVWEPGVRWSFTGTASSRPRLTRSLVEDCVLTERDGGTEISYSMYLDPPPLLRPLVKAAARGIRANNAKAVAGLAARAAMDPR